MEKKIFAFLTTICLLLSLHCNTAQAAPSMAKVAAAYYDSFDNGASPNWDAYLAAQPRYYLYKVNGKQGLWDAQGRTVVAAHYKEICDIHGYTVIVKNGDYGLVRAYGADLTPLDFDSLSYDLATNSFIGVKGNKEYTLDGNGRSLTSGNLANSDTETKKFLTDKAASKDAKISMCKLANGGSVQLAKNKFIVRDATGKKIKTWHGNSLSKNLRGGFLLSDKEKYTFFDENMLELKKVKALTCEELPNGVFIITRKKSGVSVVGIAKSILAFGLDQVGGLPDRWFNPGKKHNKRSIAKSGYVDNRGNEFVPSKFDYLGNFYNGRALVMDRGKFGYAAENGSYAVPLEFSDISTFSFYNQDSLLVKKGDKVGFYLIDHGLIATGFSDGRNFVNGVAAAKNSNGKWGYLSLSGQPLTAFVFDEVTPFFGERAIVKKQGSYAIIDKNGTVVATLPEITQASALKNGSALVKSGSKYGIIDENGNYLKNPLYDNLEVFHDLTKLKGVC